MPGNNDGSRRKPKNRFLRSLNINGEQTYLIIDYRFWVRNELALFDWLKTHTVHGYDTQQGMTLSFANEQEELLFILRWDGLCTKD
jgi:hypothetical protein